MHAYKCAYVCMYMYYICVLYVSVYMSIKGLSNNFSSHATQVNVGTFLSCPAAPWDSPCVTVT